MNLLIFSWAVSVLTTAQLNIPPKIPATPITHISVNQTSKNLPTSKLLSSKTQLQQESNVEINLINSLYNGFDKGPQQKKYIYTVDNNWKSTVENFSYDTPNQANLSWKISHILDGLDFAYKFTGDKKFLDTSIDMYNELIQKKDDYLQRPAFDGNIYNLWGSTSRYNGAYFSIKDYNGITAVRLKFNCQHNDSTFVSTSTNNDGSFNIHIKHKQKIYDIFNITYDNIYDKIFQINWTFYGSPLPNKKVVEVVDTNTSCSNIKPHDYIRVENTNVPTVIHNGLILEPMVKTYINLCEINSPLAQIYKNEITNTFNTVVQLFWNNNGYFKEIDNSPTILGGGQILPYNQQFPMIAAMAEYENYTNEGKYQKYITEFCDYFLEHVVQVNNCYLFKYWDDPTNTVTYYETTNYGAIDFSSIYSIYKCGFGFTDYDMQMFANTIKNNILKNQLSPATRIDGAIPSKNNLDIIYKYISFYNYIPELKDILLSLDLSWDNCARILYYVYG